MILFSKFAWSVWITVWQFYCWAKKSNVPDLAYTYEYQSILRKLNFDPAKKFIELVASTENHILLKIVGYFCEKIKIFLDIQSYARPVLI